jgi:opacity protein-like surface antigen
MKRIFKTLFVFGIAAFLLVTTAQIASAKPAGPFYVGVFGAFVVPEDLEWGSGDDDWYDDDWDIEDDLDESWAVGVKIGYIIPQLRFLAVELEYTYLADQDYGETYLWPDGLESYDGDFSAHNLMANLLFRYPNGKIHPYIGFGLGLSRATIEENYRFDEDGGDVFMAKIDEDDTAFAAQFITGVNFEITPNLSADLTYKYFYSEYDIKGWDVEARNHLFSMGINVHF